MTTTTALVPTTYGTTDPDFEHVRDVFEDNFTHRGELGGACCAYVRGRKVVDLWGGVRDKHTNAPWEEDTMAVVHSATKGLAAMTLAVANSRGWLDYDERVCGYWPEFAQNDKERITVRQLLAHQAGLFAIGEPVDRDVVADPDRLAAVLARQRPAWEPGTRLAYHALSLGFYEGELMRHIDPRHRSLGRSSTRKSPNRSASTSTFACPKRSRTIDWRRSRLPARYGCRSIFHSGSRSKW
jgi:CubicO group peptidase (beta-lactamase class C family)